MSEPYRSTPIIDENTLPAALRTDHKTKDGAWGVVRVIEGEVMLTYVDPFSEKVLTPGDFAVVEPQQAHFVTPRGPMRMQVDFYKEPPTF